MRSRVARAAMSVALGTALLAGACQAPVLGSHRYERLEDARSDPSFSQVGVLDILPQSAGPLYWVIDPTTRLRCAHIGVPRAEEAGVAQGLLAAGFDLYRGRVPAPPTACAFGWRRGRVLRRGLRDGAVYRNGEADDEVPAFGVVAPGALFFWWEPPALATAR